MIGDMQYNVERLLMYTKISVRHLPVTTAQAYDNAD